MRFHLPNSTDLRAFVRRVFLPKTKMGKFTLWFGYLAAVLQVLRAILHSAPGSFVSGWTSLITLMCGACALLMVFRWLRRRLLWRLRNRLIVTYVFIGVIPVILLVAMAFLAGYLFAGQFATYVAGSELQFELRHLQITNRTLAAQFRTLWREGKLTQQLAGEIASPSNESFSHRSVTVWDGDKGFVLAEPGRTAPQSPIKPSPALRGDFAGVVLDNGRLQLRAVKRLEEGDHQLTVISNLSITAELLRPVTSQLGSVSLFLEEQPANPGPSSPPTATRGKPAGQGQSKVTIQVGDSKFNVSKDKEEPGTVSAGTLPPPVNSLDFRLPFGTRFNVIDWTTGKPLLGLMLVDTRPSMIYATLFSTLGEKAGVFRDVLIGIAIFFGVIELIALLIGARLTRSMTKSVAELYTATQYVNRGELTHQIRRPHQRPDGGAGTVV